MLRGAAARLERDRPLLVCEVLHGLTKAELQEILEPLGHSYLLSTDRGLGEKSALAGDPSFRQLNYLFARERDRDRLRETVGWRRA